MGLGFYTSILNLPQASCEGSVPPLKSKCSHGIGAEEGLRGSLESGGPSEKGRERLCSEG